MAREFEILNANVNLGIQGVEKVQNNLIDLEEIAGNAVKSLKGLNAVKLTALQQSAATAFDKLGTNTVKIDQLKDRINSLNTETSSSITSFIGRLSEVRSGLNLAFQGEGVGAKASGIRQALFGLTDQSNILAKGLDFLSNTFIPKLSSDM